MEAGLVDEVRALVARYGDADLRPLRAIGYRQALAVVRGAQPADQAQRDIVKETMRYAKRQMTWFSREPEVRWIDVDQAGGIEGAAEGILKVVMEEGLIEIGRAHV